MKTFLLIGLGSFGNHIARKLYDMHHQILLRVMEFAPRTGRDGCKYNCQSADSSAEHHQHKNQPRDRSELSCDAEAYADGSDGGSGFEQTGDQRKPLKSADDNAACHKNSQIQEENCNRIPDDSRRDPAVDPGDPPMSIRKIMTRSPPSLICA